MFYSQVDSPVGVLTVASDGSAITHLHIAGDRYFTDIPADWRHNETHPVLQQALRQLREYFLGQRSKFDVTIHPNGTPFQQQVWQALQNLETHHPTTYQAIANSIGKPTAVRAVGSAIGRNPICIIIPCHRVLASNGGLGGYVAGLDKKAQLLAFERAHFKT
jgi:methylated-DNA-[protein]-cysteine S-methyltransferase